MDWIGVPVHGGNEEDYKQFMADWHNLFKAVQTASNFVATEKSFHSVYMKLPDFQDKANKLCHDNNFIMTSDVAVEPVNGTEFMYVTVRLSHISGYSMQRRYGFVNVPRLQLTHDPGNTDRYGNQQGIHTQSNQNQMDYATGVSKLITTSLRRAFFSLFNIHPEAYEEGNDNYQQGQQQAQPQQQTAPANYVGAAAPSTAPGTADNFVGTVLENYVWGFDDEADLAKLGEFMTASGITGSEAQLEAWNNAVTAVGDPRVFEGEQRINAYWQLAYHIGSTR